MGTLLAERGGNVPIILDDALVYCDDDRINALFDALTPIFDYDPAQAIKSRKAVLNRVATDRIMVMGYHFPFPAIGHVVRHGTAYHWEAAQWAW